MPVTTGSYSPKTFILAGCGRNLPCTITSGLQLVAGTVLGKVSATGLFVAYASSATDGSEKAVGILNETIDTTSVGYGGAYEASMLVGNALLDYTQLTGIDVDAITDLGGKMIGTDKLQLF